MGDLRLRPAAEADVAPLLALINGYAERNLLLRRSEESLRARLRDFLVAESDGAIVGCGALSELGPGLGEVRSLAVRADQAGRGIGHALVERLVAWAGERGFSQVLSLTRRVSFFQALGFEVTDRRRFEDKLRTDCQTCPLNVCCDETALVRPAPQPTGVRGFEAATELTSGATSGPGVRGAGAPRLEAATEFTSGAASGPGVRGAAAPRSEAATEFTSGAASGPGVRGAGAPRLEAATEFTSGAAQGAV